MIENTILLRGKLEDAVKSSVNVNSDPSINNLKEGILWFERILNYSTGIKGLDGINATLLDSLNDMYVVNDNPNKALRVIAIEAETFLEKIVYLVKGVDYSGNKSMTFINMVDELDLSLVIKNRSISAGDYFTEQRTNDFIGEPDFVEHLSRSYIRRNEITHNSPDYDPAEVYVTSKSLLIVMLFATIKHINKIKEVISEDLDNLRESSDLSLIDSKTEVLYNFISHGDSSREIKEQIIEAYLLLTIYKNGEITVDKLTVGCNDQFSTKFTKSILLRTINRLEKDGKVIAVGDNVKLTENEFNALKEQIEGFRYQEQLFKQNIKDALLPYYLQEKVDEVYLALNELVEKNYRTDLSEIFDRYIGDNNITTPLYAFKKKLENLLLSRGNLSEDSSISLILDLLSVCQQNDFLYKKCAGVVYEEIANPNGIQAYARQLKRDVYLDTNVLMFVLCKNFYDITAKDIPEYEVIKDLLKISSSSNKISLNTYSEYVLELAYQIRAGLLLIPFEDVGYFQDGYNSGNLFYKFYAYVKAKNMLVDDVESFEDFMEDVGFLYNDLFQKNPLSIIAEICEDILYDEKIEVKFFDEQNIEQFYDKLMSITEGKRGRRRSTNDANMVSFLNNKRNHELDPYFVTYDSVFFKLRDYALKISNRSQYWHLYFPSRFVAHLNLLEFRVDTKNFTNDFMSILTKSSFQEDTTELIDILSGFFDIRGDNERRLLRKLRSFTIQYTYKTTKTDGDSEERSENHPLGELLKEISYHYNGRESSNNLLDVKRYIVNPENYDSVVSLFDEELKYYNLNKQFTKELYKKIDSLISEK